LIWNDEQGLVISVAKNTRQTSVSCAFVEWMCDADQREALRLVCPRIELLPSQSDRSGIRSDYRAFQSMNLKPHLNHGLELSLRFANGMQYKKALADCLIQVIRSPDDAAAIMAECTASWNEISNQLGHDKQRTAIEQSLGFQK
jgi:hypothetical protein